MLVELWVTQDGDSPSVVDQREGGAAVQALLVCTRDGQDHRHRQVNDPTYKQRSKVTHTKYISHTKAPSNRQLFKGLQGSRGYGYGFLCGGGMGQIG